ncbi:unnamed protein product, partial [Brenthis ino]
MLPTVEESRGYDFQDPANSEKWRGLFVNPLRKVLQNVHPTLNAEQSALEFVESLCLRLLAMLCAVPSPLTVQVHTHTRAHARPRAPTRAHARPRAHTRTQAHAHTRTQAHAHTHRHAHTRTHISLTST